MVRARNTDDSHYKEEQRKHPNPYNGELPLSGHDRICTFSSCPYQHYSPPLFGPARYGRHLQPSADLEFPRDRLACLEFHAEGPPDCDSAAMGRAVSRDSELGQTADQCRG